MGSLVGAMPSAITNGSKLIRSQSAPFCGIAAVIVERACLDLLAPFGPQQRRIVLGVAGLADGYKHVPAHWTLFRAGDHVGSRKSVPAVFISSSVRRFSPSSGTKRQRTRVASFFELMNWKV